MFDSLKAVFWTSLSVILYFGENFGPYPEEDCSRPSSFSGNRSIANIYNSSSHKIVAQVAKPFYENLSISMDPNEMSSQVDADADPPQFEEVATQLANALLKAVIDVIWNFFQVSSLVLTLLQCIRRMELRKLGKEPGSFNFKKISNLKSTCTNVIFDVLRHSFCYIANNVLSGLFQLFFIMLPSEVSTVNCKPEVTKDIERKACKNEQSDDFRQDKTHNKHGRSIQKEIITRKHGSTIVNHCNNYTLNSPKYDEKVTIELTNKLYGNPEHNIALFDIDGISPKLNVFQMQHDFASVRLPSLERWNTITKTLEELSNFVKSDQTDVQNLGDVLSQVVHNYREVRSWGPPNFGVLGSDSLRDELKAILPIIIDHALALPKLLWKSIPILRRGESKTIFVNQRLTCSLMANGFLCTMPQEEEEMPDFNFFRLFEREDQPQKSELKAQKIRCILQYFATIAERMAHSENLEEGAILSYERRCIRATQKWSSSKSKLISAIVEPLAGIEEASDCLQVDFANKVVGGSVLGTGAVMEEIRFSICPELILSRLFTEPLDDDEVLMVTGTGQFSNYSGYGSTFQFRGRHHEGELHLDEFGRRKSRVVAMDALHFRREDADTQFEKSNVDRELHKCFVAFSNTPDNIDSVPIATGNWGCGVFNGNPELKFFVQWIAASQAGRPRIQYHTIGNVEQSQKIEAVVKQLLRRGTEVGTLYKLLLQFYEEKEEWGSLFEFVAHSVRNRRRGSDYYVKVKSV